MKLSFQKLGNGLLKPTFLAVILSVFSAAIFAQKTTTGAKVVDKTVATVSDGVRTELITYSDLVWQLALNPSVSIDSPSSENLNRALQILIRFRLIALESERLPSQAPTTDEIDKEILRVVEQFPSTAAFVQRLKKVGFNSVRDENFISLMQKRVAIEKYIEFRFRSFVVITPEEEKRYYNNEFSRDFRRRNPGLLLPKFEDVQQRINTILTERRVESDIERFLDNAESRAEIVVLIEV